jgi:hypothetical protein
MAHRLLPLTMSELCLHALQLERDTSALFKIWVGRLRQLGEFGLATAMIHLEEETQMEISALHVASGNARSKGLAPWEYAWRLAADRADDESEPAPPPRDPGTILQLAQDAKMRAVAFYDDVATNGRDPLVRSFAADMAAARHADAVRISRLMLKAPAPARTARVAGARRG